MRNFKTLAVQGITLNGGGALSSNVSELGSKEVSKRLRNFIPRPYDGRGCHEVTGEGESQIAQQVRDDKLRHPELADCALRAELDGKMAKPLQTSIVDPLNVCNQAVSGSQAVTNPTTYSIQNPPRPSLKKGRRVAFTLAEVLITLGIIGVVASLTLPSVIHKYKIKQLHTAFLRSSSMIQNVLNEVAYDYGYNNFKAFNEICGSLANQDNQSCRNSNATLFAEISSDLISKFKVVKKMNGLQLSKQQFMITDYSGNYHFLYKELYGISTYATPHAAGYLLPDGTLVSAISFFYHEPSDGLTLTFDTNGPFKGPNRYGYDVFVFNTGTWYKMCTKNSSGTIFNGRGCYDYALKDINPDDSTKGYWDSL